MRSKPLPINAIILLFMQWQISRDQKTVFHRISCIEEALFPTPDEEYKRGKVSGDSRGYSRISDILVLAAIWREPRCRICHIVTRR
nr:hypothetical protein 220p1_00028 [Serratia entomophila]